MLTIFTSTATPKKGRRSAPQSRAAREQTRRQNHSKIEKRRRTKINAAMAELRRLVPAGFSHDREQDDEETAQGGGGGKEKEFKLEVLEKTVAYMAFLINRVKELEDAQCQAQTQPQPRSVP